MEIMKEKAEKNYLIIIFRLCDCDFPVSSVDSWQFLLREGYKTDRGFRFQFSVFYLRGGCHEWKDRRKKKDYIIIYNKLYNIYII